jgi:hypothetical protein
LKLKKTIEKLRELKSDLDGAFDQGKIDLDKISAGLEEAAGDLESLEKSFTADKPSKQNIQPSPPSVISASKTQILDVADYR